MDSKLVLVCQLSLDLLKLLHYRILVKIPEGSNRVE